MADLTYTADLNDKISPKLQKIEENVKGLKEGFSQLQGVIAGLAIGSVIQSSFQLASALTSVSKGTNIAVESVIGFGQALTANGGAIDKAADGLNDFVKNLGDAAGGSTELRKAFADLGVSTTDIQRLSERDILKKLLESLSKIPDAATRNSVAMKIFGESVKGVELDKLNADFDKFTENAKGTAPGVIAAASAQKNFAIAINEFKIQILAALEPMSKLAMRISEITDLIAPFVKVAVQIGSIAAMFFVATKAVTVLKYALAALTTGWQFLLTGVQTAINLFKNFGAVVGELKALNAFASALRVVINLLIEMSKWVWANIPGIVALTTAVVAFYDDVKKLIGIEEELAVVQSDAETARLARQNAMLENSKKTIETQRELVDVFEKQKQQIQETAMLFAKQNAETIKAVQFEAQLIGKTEDQVELQRALNDMRLKSQQEIEKLRQAQRNLSKEEMHLSSLYDEQISKIEKQTQADMKRLTTAINNLQTVRILEQARQKDIENTTKAIEDQIARQSQLGDVLQRINDQRVDLEFERSQQGRSPLEQQIEQIKENARKAALEAGRAFAAAFDNEDGLSPEKAEELAKGLEMIAKRYEDIANMQIQNLEASMTWEAGWKDAFDKYIDNATNAANRARDVFSAVTSGMERLISDFVDTGKFKFKDFARSVIAEILKIELKAAASNLWKIIAGSMGGGGGGLFGGSIIPGFLAEGGPAIANKPYIVGERGPELFVPKGTGTVVPNNQLGASQPVTNNYVYNISAVDAQSVARLFANNRQVLLGSVEQAKKELPTRRGMR
jgi:lambda family phage tail tape measure protein